jgi:hypothetical protein
VHYDGAKAQSFIVQNYDAHYDGAKPQSCVFEKICTMGGQRCAVPAGHNGKKLFFELQTL